MTEKLLNQQVRAMADHLEYPRGVAMGVSDRLILRKLAREKVNWPSRDPALTPEEAILDGVVMAMNGFSNRYK